MHLLKEECIKSSNISAFSFTTFIGMSLPCVALDESKLLISSLLTVSKTNNEWLGKAFLTAILLGWFLHFSFKFEIGSSLSSKGIDHPLYSGIFKFTTVSVKKVFKVSTSCMKILIY